MALNKIFLHGKVWQEPKQIEMNKRKAVMFILSVPRYGKGFDYFQIIALDKLMSLCYKLRKEQEVIIEGSCHINIYNKNGEKRNSTVVTLASISFASKKKFEKVQEEEPKTEEIYEKPIANSNDDDDLIYPPLF